ncbi:hypothetical protein [Frigoriglobus tundricola]|uniref:Uncharacterized protein n=1 Tax=Frigoriglobus tundricola TaxID=2774151 RepID=A0A6M5YYB1_9BACT|nr:hypothetical protein [Frigoriglobus tundricola]QJW98416.1 hypothetical protein FTUN_6006 [Frigoriglobus tundricola]
MSEKPQLADRILSRRAAPPDDSDGYDDYGTFALLRGVKERSVMLEFRLTGGNSVAVAYALLEQVLFDPSEGITLRFLGVTVKLRGRNLSRSAAANTSVLEGLHRHRVSWVAEVDEFHSAVRPTDIAVVTRIEITPVK